jgi:MFS family permease
MWPGRSRSGQRHGAELGNDNVTSAWAPLRLGVFRALWIATLVSNLGTAMQNAGAAWMMTSLTASPVIISLVQTAGTLPVLLLGLPAGAIADIVNRRRFLLLTQAAMLLAAVALGVVSLGGIVTPAILLSLTFAMGLGAALNGPAWQALIGEIVPPSDLSGAVSLNSAGFNIARSIGPAVAGLVMAHIGAGWVFLLNAVSFVGVLWVLFRWKPITVPSPYPAEHVLGAVRAGLRYLIHASELRAVVLRTIAFAFPASALWALLPVAPTSMGGKAVTYGILLGGLGIGALLGAAILPILKRTATVETLVFLGTCTFFAATVGTAFLQSVAILFPILVVGGMGWLLLLSTINAATRLRVPRWVEARALAFYLLSYRRPADPRQLAAGPSGAQGALALGGIVLGCYRFRRWNSYITALRFRRRPCWSCRTICFSSEWCRSSRLEACRRLAGA